ncbi:MAG: TatD family hydrolase [Bacteroidales bacterium]|jgi:TatD DNase family protein|nr:TatD family hydrolase [Bacteroidales bacterium]
MRLIDTHTHLYLPEFDADRDEAVYRAVSSGVEKMLMPNINENSIGPMLAAAERYSGVCLPMLGLHPTDVKDNYKAELDRLLDLWEQHRFIAVGEIGIDLYWDRTYIEEQKEALRRQCAFALVKNVPVVIHSRDSFHELFPVLEEFRGTGLRGVLHAFTGNTVDAKRAIDLGFFLGIGGIVTFKNGGIDAVVRHIGPRRLILETDSPYLAPVPHRGKRNESSYICIINRKVSEITGMTEEEVAELTSANASELFNIE